jgi:L-seryl-tRNA(Ser) seleniumtransferase
MPDTDRSLLRRIPAVDRVLERPGIRRLEEVYGREAVKVQVRGTLEGIREHVRRSGSQGLAQALDALEVEVESDLRRRYGSPLRRVLNATGVFLHTNLGRAPLPRQVADEIPRLLDAYCDLEMDLDSGERSDRSVRLAAVLEAITGAGAALVVNNNAAALVLVLAALAREREVVVSRGELVEIGGSFRIPDILEASGARLREVGTTNRTRIEDYRGAAGDATAMILKVHPSNYRIRGFAEETGTAELAGLARDLSVPLVVDEGAGLLVPREETVFRDHPSVREHLTRGADLVTASGDKLLGGPQAGLLLGRHDLVSTCRRHPLFRALRPDRSTVAALERVLAIHRRGERLPLDRLWPYPASHRARLEAIAAVLDAEIVPLDAFVGGGAAPDEPVAGLGLALAGSDALARRLRRGRPPVVGYLRESRLLLDLRTVDPADDEDLVQAVLAARESW